MKYFISAVLFIATFAAMFHYCSPSGMNKTGHEYMPDMVHPVSYEANVYSAYSWNHWDKASAFSKYSLSQPQGKVAGTIPRGMTANYYGAAGTARGAMLNGEAPFYYTNSEAERTRCSNEIMANPLPITKAGLAAAKPLYEIYCGVCHGNKGNGQGFLVSEENPAAKYGAQPANFLKDEFLGASDGRYIFGIMYGKNVMGSYADKLSWEERWQVIHYIRSLQAASLNAEYSEGANTFSVFQAEKAAKWAAEQKAAKVATPVAAPIK